MLGGTPYCLAGVRRLAGPGAAVAGAVCSTRLLAAWSRQAGLDIRRQILAAGRLANGGLSILHLSVNGVSFGKLGFPAGTKISECSPAMRKQPLDKAVVQTSVVCHSLPSHVLVGGRLAGHRAAGPGQRGRPGHPRPGRERFFGNIDQAWWLLFCGAGSSAAPSASACTCCPDPQAARPQVDAERLRDHLPDLQDVPDPAGQVPADAVRPHRLRHGLLLAGPRPGGPTIDPAPSSRWSRPALLDRRHGRLVRGGLVRHPRQHLRQLAAPPSPRSAASPGTSSTSRCGRACRSACS